MRQFTDDQGTRWEILQVSSDTLTSGRPDFLPAAFRNGWLVFDSGVERRRLAPFPAEWQGFAQDALLLLLRSAERVENRRARRTGPAAESGQSEQRGAT